MGNTCDNLICKFQSTGVAWRLIQGCLPPRCWEYYSGTCHEVDCNPNDSNNHQDMCTCCRNNGHFLQECAVCAVT
jgi:hypothetical protein